jgi:WD40 repeat protein
MVRLWDPETGIELAVICGCKDDVNTFAYSPDGRRIVSGDGTFRLWDAKSGAMLAVLHARNTGYDYHITFSPDGGRIAITRAAFDEPRYRDFKILVWDAERGIKLAVLRGHSGNFLCTTYSPDGQQIATGSEDSTVCVWDAENGAKLAMLRGHEDGVVSVAYSSDGCRIVSTSYDGTIRVWDAQTHKCLEVIEVSGESEANAAGVPEMPLRPIARVHETVIEQTRDGEPLAWFPTALEQIAAHPSGQIWVGAASNHLFIIRFEGITELARQEDITKH